MTWEEAWQEGRTGWDAGAPAPALIDFLEGGTDWGGKALVPGCGAGYDVFALARHGFEAHGLDIAPSVVQVFEGKRDEASISADQAKILIEDFFSWTPAAPYDLIWDYTFLCAIQPERREAWVERMSTLLADTGRLVTLIFPVDPSNPSPSTSDEPGPPFRLHPDFVTDLLAERFERESLGEVHRSHEGRGGKEWLAVWRKRA